MSLLWRRFSVEKSTLINYLRFVKISNVPLGKVTKLFMLCLWPNLPAGVRLEGFVQNYIGNLRHLCHTVFLDIICSVH